MITLIKGQSILGNENYLVFDSGDYNETDLVQVCHVDNQNVAIASYQAFYIKNGYDYLSEPTSPKSFKIGYEDPTIIDYDILGFQKKRTIIFGELVKVQYYEFYDGIDYSNLIVEETRQYTRDMNGLVQHRNQTSKWYLSDDSIGLTKNTIKYYTLEEAIQEGIDRRSNVLSKAKAYVITNIGQAYSFDLLTSVKGEIQYFSDGYTQPLRDAIINSSKPYLNQSIKDGIIESLRLN
jgi:hypothetical protein